MLIGDITSIADWQTSFDAARAGAEAHSWIREWYPINRSLTGEGVREQLRALQALVPLEIHAVPTGEQVLDWTVPKEWNVRDAYVKNAAGERVIDFRKHNLHVMGYSVPVHETLPLGELKKKIYTLPDYPDRIPYRTSYYKENWAFCAQQSLVEALRDGDYEVLIDSTLEEGVLNYGELVLPGSSEDEILISAHVCHPSLANDNLSSIAVAVQLAQRLVQAEHRYTYRFLFAPGTIGAITWLARNRERVERIRHGLVLACLGDGGSFHYKRSRHGDAEVDRAVQLALRDSGGTYEILDFTPYGYDERQYCSPGFNLPVGCFMRSQPGSFPEYHTSADNVDFLRPEFLGESLQRLLSVVEVLEGNDALLNLSPHGEPQLGRRGLYSAVGGATDQKQFEMALLWVLNFSDGAHSLLDIAQRSNLSFTAIRAAADALMNAELLSSERLKAQRQKPGKLGRAASPLAEANSTDFWDDFIDGEPDLSDAALTEYFKDLKGKA